MGQSAFVREEDDQVIKDHQIVPEEIHQKYMEDLEAVIIAIEMNVSMEREEKVVPRVSSRGSSRTSSRSW